MKKNSVGTCILIQLFLLFFYSLQGSTTVLFSPEDQPTEKLIALLRSAKKRIYAAVYMITDKNIVNELIIAKQDRKIDVQIITDKISVDTSWGQGKKLADKNIPVFLFTGDPHANLLKKNNMYINSIMHHKFAVIDKIVWCGSFNWTRSANLFNREDIIIINKKEICDRYTFRFNDLKALCKQLPADSKTPSKLLINPKPLTTALSLTEKIFTLFKIPGFTKKQLI